MRCETCMGDGGWWLDRQGRRLPFQMLHRAVAWMPCDNCGGSAIQSCCDGATGGPSDVTNAQQQRAGRDG
jgi:hypothetical protein